MQLQTSHMFRHKRRNTETACEQCDGVIHNVWQDFCQLWAAGGDPMAARMTSMAASTVSSGNSSLGGYYLANFHVNVLYFSGIVWLLTITPRSLSLPRSASVLARSGFTSTRSMAESRPVSYSQERHTVSNQYTPPRIIILKVDDFIVPLNNPEDFIPKTKK